MCHPYQHSFSEPVSLPLRLLLIHYDDSLQTYVENRHQNLSHWKNCPMADSSKTEPMLIWLFVFSFHPSNHFDLKRIHNLLLLPTYQFHMAYSPQMLCMHHLATNYRIWESMITLLSTKYLCFLKHNSANGSSQWYKQMWNLCLVFLTFPSQTQFQFHFSSDSALWYHAKENRRILLCE